MANIVYILVAILLIVGIYLSCRSSRENFRDPIYLNRKKMLCDWYPRANCSIYGLYSNLL